MDEMIVWIPVTDVERRIMIKGLEKLKMEQISQNKKYDFIDDIIVKACDATSSHSMNKKKERYETR